MPASPDEIRRFELDREPRGYDRGSVDKLLDELVRNYEELWRERAELSERLQEADR